MAGIGDSSARQPAITSAMTEDQRARQARSAFAWRWMRRVGLALALLVAVFLVDLGWTWFSNRTIVTALRDSIPDLTSYMRQRADEGHPVRRRGWIALDSMPSAVVCSVLAAENVRFFEHGTLDWSNQRDMMRRAMRGDVSRGGSGISQQLARNLFLSPERTPRR